MSRGGQKSLIKSTARFSPCGRYRYSLTRIWDRHRPIILFIGLNPSTADAIKNDPTVSRCIGFAKKWGYGGMFMANIFAYRSTDPDVLKRVADPVGPGNDAAIRRMCRQARHVVVAWGARGRLHGRGEQILTIVKEPHCLGTTQNGSPRHPLYAGGAARLRRYQGESRRG
jgi:hypothetical protein